MFFMEEINTRETLPKSLFLVIPTGITCYILTFLDTHDLLCMERVYRSL